MDSSTTPASATEAFEKNTIPAVRALESQLRANVSRDKERLRALVGGNYRELLSTAEGIVSLDKRTKEAEARISELSRQCKPPRQSDDTRSISVLSSISAQLRLLTQCITCASAALQSRSVLLCAELTVVSRLLLKSLGEQPSPPNAITSLRDKAAALRRRLLRLVRSQLAYPASSIEALVNAICAYCLVTSASSGDAVEHFRNVRLEKLRQRVESEENDPSRIKEDFRYLVVSLQLLKSILGRSVNDALSILQKKPILQDHCITKLESLDIDRLRNLIPTDILGFTPYIKRVLLKQEEVQQISSAWIREACQVFETGLRGALSETKAIGEVLALRRDLLLVILPVYFSTPALESLLETVRQVTNTRVIELCTAHVESLLAVASGIVSVKPVVDGNSSPWDVSLVLDSLSSGGTRYAHQVQSSHLGIRGDLATLLRKLKRWTKQIGQIRNQFQMLESIRWQDTLEEPDDEDEDHAKDIVKHLSEDDPGRFKEAMELSLRTTISRYNSVMQDAVSDVLQGKGNESGDSTTARIVYLLRAFRESSIILNHTISTSKLELKAPISQLHKTLADRVTKQILATLPQDVTLATHESSHPGDVPSPQAFKLLRDICRLMADTGGTDIWSEVATSSLKKNLRAELFEGESRSGYIRNEFDEYYIAAALDNGARSATKPSKQDDPRSKAEAYWLRTRLLFGALG